MSKDLLAFIHTPTPQPYKKPLKIINTAGGNLLEKEQGYTATTLVSQKILLQTPGRISLQTQ